MTFMVSYPETLQSKLLIQVYSFNVISSFHLSIKPQLTFILLKLAATLMVSVLSRRRLGKEISLSSIIN